MMKSLYRHMRVAGAAGVALALFALVSPAALGTTVTGAPNPPWPDKCGVDAALLIDHSNSIMLDDAGNPALLKDAAKSLADALSGTPSRMAVHSFWKTAQQEIDWTATSAAGVADVKDAIDTIPFFTSNSNGSTNWDEAFRDVEDLGAEIVIILTDGNPTVHLNNYLTGGTTQQEDIDEGVASANRVKSAGLDGVTSRIVAVGIGSGVSVANLKLISGPNANDDYFTTDFDSLKNMLLDIPTRFCGGSVTVEKLAQNADGSFSATPGWAFTTSLDNAPPPAITVDPADGHTNAAGLATFSWKSTGTEVATVVEAARAGYALQSATCKEGDDPFPSQSVTRGVKLTLGPTDNVKCVFRNVRTNPAITVEKTATPTLASVGQTVDYDFTVTNTGNLKLTNVTLVDNRFGPITLADTTLDPNESTTGTASHVVALADLPGPHVNVATATGTPPTGPAVSDTDDASVALKTAPAINVVKSGPVKAHFGDAVTYGFAVTNTGDVPLIDVSVDDDKLGHIGDHRHPGRERDQDGPVPHHGAGQRRDQHGHGMRDRSAGQGSLRHRRSTPSTSSTRTSPS